MNSMRCVKRFESDNRMRLQMLILAFFVLVEGYLQKRSLCKMPRNDDFACPPATAIKPCKCTRVPIIPTIQCDGASNLKTIHSALKEWFQCFPIPYLKLRNAHFTRLPSRAFSSIKVNRLELKDSNFRYISSAAFQGMDSLTVLRLHNVNLLTFPSESLNHLPSLMTLSIKTNNLRRILYSDLSGVQQLKHLCLSDNNLRHIGRGSFPVSLVTLFLSKNSLITLNQSVRNLFSLEWLFLDHNFLLSIKGELKELFKLKHLNLANNRISDLGSSLHNLHNLEVLDLQHNDIHELGTSLWNLRQLKELNLRCNHVLQLNDDSFTHLTSLTNLDLSNNKLLFLNEGLRPLFSLKAVDLSRNKILDFSFHEISSLSNLTVINLNDNGLKYLNSSSSLLTLPSTTLFLAKNRLSRFNGFLKHFPRLEELDISSNRFHVLTISQITIAPRIYYINVKGNPLICDAEQMDMYLELQNLDIEVDGRPICNTEPYRM
ncbi:leucine-rich repeat and death domain-containing protein 1-like [Stegodyphus dumicola]|uniref:leucine-rich repeat and death domain-containing protein 1-like n=1 Tax=Stegodyphus dumicola TaxID=202533 RepID=UPI0015AEEF0D|nr:leucine-rich repeat and death domain-containing protein 1-like [Stegodyphus dumicola]